ncbi:phytosulfokines-like [Humulus lupulus]|uniref:phytosulfokines-like n=1 Tax=Humulus lupulus TaxID=3486 RepID=UPI002B41016E|nr:phytosulfokines-like [Humulus lupulus]
MSSKVVTALFLLSLLLLFSVNTCLARPGPSSSASISNSDNTVIPTKDIAHKVINEADQEESCEGVEEEECLMRRTLAAHTDYIYTQKQNP